MLQRTSHCIYTHFYHFILLSSREASLTLGLILNRHIIEHLVMRSSYDSDRIQQQRPQATVYYNSKFISQPFISSSSRPSSHERNTIAHLTFILPLRSRTSLLLKKLLLLNSPLHPEKTVTERFNSGHAVPHPPAFLGLVAQSSVRGMPVDRWPGWPGKVVGAMGTLFAGMFVERHVLAAGEGDG